MKIGLIGLPQTGKKTLFELLTGHRLLEKDLLSNKPIKGTAEIRDPRFDKIASIYNPQKEVRARIEIELLPKLEKDSIAKGDVFKDINNVDAVCHLVRAFKDDSVYHPAGSVDARRDIDNINSELLLNDMLFIEKRLERIEKDIKKTSDKAAIKERELLVKLKAQLDKELPLRLMELTAEENKTIASYPFVTLKEMVLALNVSDDKLQENSLLEKLRNLYQHLKVEIMQVSVKAESEIAALESEQERREFLEALGIKEPAIDILTHACLRALNLISFFTVTHNELRQWNIRRGCLAVEAAGAIHTDLQRGFIRAEVVKYNDLIALGTEEKIKEAGKFYLKGKDYVVEDADIITVRFNV
jgi:GTP-binding protein YchF